MDEQIIKLITELQARNDAAALVTIVGTRGSTPRKAGAKMLVKADGAVYGTIGGGCVEADVRRVALQAIDSRQSTRYSVALLDDAAAQDGMACGGTMEVFINVISG